MQVLPLAFNTTYSFGTPGYYLMAFEPDGISTTTFVGVDHSNLTWQVNHAAGQSQHELIRTSDAYMSTPNAQERN